MSSHRLTGDDTVQLGPAPVRPGRPAPGQHRTSDLDDDGDGAVIFALLIVAAGLLLILIGSLT